MTEGTASRVRRAVGSRVAVDRRALAAFRLALAAVVLVDLGRRAPDLVAFYTDRGALPRDALAAAYPGWGRFSLHALSGGVALQVALFLLAGVAALALLVGYRTRLATAVSLVLLISLQVRNPLVLNAGDVLLRRLLTWAVFLPLGSRWALDAAGEGGADGEPAERAGVGGWGPPGTVAGVATAGLLLQVVVVYVTNAVVKLRSAVWLGGDAVRYAFQVDHFTWGLGDVVAGWTPALVVADWAWLAMLVASPLLVILRGRARTALVALFAGAHAGMLLTLHIGVFPLVSLTALLPFCPPAVWDRLERRAGRLRALSERGTARRPLAARVPALSVAARAVAVCAVVVVLLLNAVSLGVVAAPPGTPDRVEERQWDMFAPSPPTSTWWYAAPGTLASGERVDALRGGAYDPSRPGDVATRYRNERWRKFLNRATADPRLRRSLAGYLCTRWNRTHDDGLVGVQLVKLTEETALDGPETVSETAFERHRCGAVRDG